MTEEKYKPKISEFLTQAGKDLINTGKKTGKGAVYSGKGLLSFSGYCAGGIILGGLTSMYAPTVIRMSCETEPENKEKNIFQKAGIKAAKTLVYFNFIRNHTKSYKLETLI